MPIFRVFRSLRRSPGFTAVTVLTLAIGIGASTAIFSVVHAVVIQPLPYPHADRLVRLFHEAPGYGWDQMGVPPGFYFHYRRTNPFLEEIGLYRVQSANLAGDGDPIRLNSAVVSHSLLSTLGLTTQLGRNLTPAEDQPGGPPVVLVSDRLWRSRFGASADLVGRQIRVDDTVREVIGVLPRGLDFPDASADLWLPAAFDSTGADPGNFVFQAIGRLRIGASTTDVERHMDAQIGRLEEIFPQASYLAGFASTGRLRADVTSLKEALVGHLERPLWVLLAGVGIVLLIACGNVANLYLARAETRRGEMALRAALGAGHRRLATHYYGEALVLALIGGISGVALAWVVLPLIIQLAPLEIPRLDQVGLSREVLLFSAAVAALALIVFPTPAVWRYASPRPADAINRAGLRATGGRAWSRELLLVSQTALALILLVGAGLLASSYRRLISVETGLESEGVLTFRLNLPAGQYPDLAAAVTFHERLLARLQALPGVQRAGAVSRLPLLSETTATGHDVEGQYSSPDETPPMILFKEATPDYFQTLGIPLLAGRSFEALDSRQPRHVVLVSRALADRLWPGEEAIGKRIRPARDNPPAPWHDVVGVVGNVRDQGLAEPPAEILYYPLGPAGGPGRLDARELAYVVAGEQDPDSLVPLVRAEVLALDPDLPLAGARNMEEIERTINARAVFSMTVVSVASAVAVLLGAIGLYGVLTYRVSRMRREIGIRMALGAPAARVRSEVLIHALKTVAAGLIAGLAGALAATRLMASMLFETSTTEPLVFGAITLLLLLVALVASYVPARAASRVDPNVALKA